MTRFRWTSTLVLLVVLMGSALAGRPAYGQEGASDPPPAPGALPPAPTPDSQTDLGPAVDWSRLALPQAEVNPAVVPPSPWTAPPTPPAPQPVPVPAGSITYVVERGDTLYRIALRFGVPVNALALVNGIANSHEIYAGQTLIIPAPAEAPAAVPPAAPVEVPAGDPVGAPIAPAPDEAAAPLSYTVQRGDTLYRIALRFEVTVPAIVTTNAIPNPDRISVGQVLTIPGRTAPAATPPQGGGPAPVTPTGDTYVVQRGDTLGLIAGRLGVTVADLVAANNIADPNRISIGQVLQIVPGAGQSAAPQSAAPAPTPLPTAAATPAPTAAPAATPAPAPDPTPAPAAGPTVYVVQSGDTLSQIAARYGVTVQAIAAANNLVNPNVLQIGQQLAIPAPGTIPAAPDQPNLFIWPVDSRTLLQYFRYGHSGIDIDVATGTTIRAAAGGVVEYSGWNAYGYGYLIVLDHQNGYKTLYAHQSTLIAATGDTVAQGDAIGLSGSTGRSTWPHLHFEVVFEYRRLNPCAYLPDGC